jgi:hypothetical protein
MHCLRCRKVLGHSRCQLIVVLSSLQSRHVSGYSRGFFMYSLPSRKIFRCGRCHIRLDLPILSAWEVFAKSWVYFLCSLWDGSILDHT